MKIKDIIAPLEELAPLNYAESFDNVGLLVGDAEQEVTGVLITLDTLEPVIDEAIAIGSNLIISFHPIIFSGLKSLTGKTYVERVVMKAIQHHIAIYSMHTALDNQFEGVNASICDRLGLQNRRILIPQPHTIQKLITYVPKADAETLRKALFAAGAGNIGNYAECSFNIEGNGTYKGNDASHPTIGTPNVFHTEAETQIGVIGELSEAMSETNFLALLQERMQAKGIRHSALRGKPIKKVAVLGGSGAFAIENAKRAGADIFVSADFKYHDFFKAEGQILLADIGHYESEQYIKLLLFEFLSKKIPTFAVSISKVDTNPIKYYS